MDALAAIIEAPIPFRAALMALAEEGLGTNDIREECIDEDDDEDIEDDKLRNHKLCEDDDGNGNPCEDDDGNGNPCEDDDGNGNPCEDNDGNSNPCEDNDGNSNPCEDNDGNSNPCGDGEEARRNRDSHVTNSRGGQGVNRTSPENNPQVESSVKELTTTASGVLSPWISTGAAAASSRGTLAYIPIDLRIQVVALIIVNECQHVGPSYYNLEPPDDFNIEPAVALLNAQIAGAYTNSQVPRDQLIVGLRTFADAKARACSLGAAKAVLIDDGLSKALLAKHTQYDRKLHVEMLKMGTKQNLQQPISGVLSWQFLVVLTNIHTEVDSHEEEVGVMDLDKEGVPHAMMDVDDAIQQNDVLDFNEDAPATSNSNILDGFRANKVVEAVRNAVGLPLDVTVINEARSSMVAVTRGCRLLAQGFKKMRARLEKTHRAIHQGQEPQKLSAAATSELGDEWIPCILVLKGKQILQMHEISVAAEFRDERPTGRLCLLFRKNQAVGRLTPPCDERARTLFLEAIDGVFRTGHMILYTCNMENKPSRAFPGLSWIDPEEAPNVELLRDRSKLLGSGTKGVEEALQAKMFATVQGPKTVFSQAPVQTIFPGTVSTATSKPGHKQGDLNGLAAAMLPTYFQADLHKPGVKICVAAIQTQCHTGHLKGVLEYESIIKRLSIDLAFAVDIGESTKNETSHFILAERQRKYD
ncbi:hypothetical protein HDU89_002924 [Geranomyces variabilis]|nr:hypothetical protein HDU89_002924 [Geranomyces variabilis]